MTTVDTKTLDALGLTRKAEAPKIDGNSLGQDTFMKLLVAQRRTRIP